MIKHILEIINNYYKLDKNIKREISKGAYVVLPNDNAYIYDRLSEVFEISNRKSSHYSIDDQYEIKLNDDYCAPVILVGTIDFRNKIHTWFQLEKTTHECFIEHLADYIEYNIHNKNIGPNGKSLFMESNPLILKKKRSVPNN